MTSSSFGAVVRYLLGPCCAFGSLEQRETGHDADGGEDMGLCAAERQMATAASAPMDSAFADSANDEEEDALLEQVVSLGPYQVKLLSTEKIPEGGEFDLTGYVWWPVSTLLAGLLIDYGKGALHSTEVLDLGSGTGIAGLWAAVCCRPRRVVLSDREAKCRSLASRNARLQSVGACAIDVEDYGWCEGDPWPAQRGSFGLILASDTLYELFDQMRSFEKWGPRYHDGQSLIRFLEMVDFCLAPGGTVLIGFELRNAVDQDIHRSYGVFVGSSVKLRLGD